MNLLLVENRLTGIYLQAMENYTIKQLSKLTVGLMYIYAYTCLDCSRVL